MKRASSEQYRAAISLLLDNLGDSQTLLAQIFNDPSNPEIPGMIAPMMKSNQLILTEVKKFCAKYAKK